MRQQRVTLPSSLLPPLLLLTIVGLSQVCGQHAKLPINELPKPMQNNWQNDDAHTVAGVAAVYQLRSGKSRRPTLMDIALQQSVREGLEAMSELYSKIQPEMLRNGQILQDNHPAALLARFNAPIEDTEQREMAAYATLTATKAFRKNYKQLNELARQSHAQKISLRRTALEGLCPPRDPPTCMPASERYRTHDGTCNNKRRPRWGGSQMPFNRFLPPEYGDGVDSVRSSTDGSALSSSRFVSLLVHGAREGDAPLTLMIAQWGQLLDHDLTSTAQPRSINGSIPSCCGGKDFHPSCFPIKVPLDDPWLSPLKVRCLEFLRSAPAQRRDCVLSWREQTNQATSYLDASPIYANSAKASDNARVFRNGLLIYGRGNPAEDVCQRGAIATQCIRSGDGRSGEQPGLLAMHHVWVGEHNRIATELSEMNPHWSDEKLYQEARRIVGAMFQHITYREFLPIILGREVCKLFDLELLNSGFYEGYDAKVNPTVANSFAAAAFRFGHSLVQNSYMRCDRHHNVINNNVSLHEEFQRGDIGSAGSLHRLLRGLATQRALKRDEFITPELTNHLFQTPGFPFGLDLAAINIQRGRDHGIAPYTTWRVPCGLSPIHNWDDFANVVGPESAKRIGHAYRSVHDIDLFVGGIAERPVVGGLVGPTFACIIAQQFSNSRKGDRFWYENGGFESSFTPAQLHAIRRVSLAQVMCRAVGSGTFQPHIFIPSDFAENERIPCGVGALAPIDLSAWLEQDPFVALTARPPVFDPHMPEQVFEIMSPDMTTNNLLISKEDKAGFKNRLRPSVAANAIAPAAGLPRPTANTTKVNDKLDLKRKNQQTNVRGTTRRPLNGVHNKLDKSPKITLNIKNVNVRRRIHTKTATTTRRTVVINNLEIELRNAERTRTKGGSETNVKTDTTTADMAEPRSEIEDSSDLGTKLTNENVATRTKPDQQHADMRTDKQMDADIDPMKQATTQTEHKRVQRRIGHERLLQGTIEQKSLTLTTTTNKTMTKIVGTKALLHLHKLSTNTTSLNFSTSTTTTQTPSVHRGTTKRGIEVRSQYQNRPIYTRPEKVVVNGPNSDQYEIEINIRQTNKAPTLGSATRPLPSAYNEYTTAYRPYGHGYASSYAPHYNDGYLNTTPGSYAYYQPPPTNGPKTARTKPPTIIYLNEYDDHRTTTRSPNIFQNFLTFATNGLTNSFRPSPTPISTVNKERPSYEPVVVNGPSSYVPRPQSQSQYPAVSSVQIAGNPNSGYMHAASSAISTGNFGSISGVASSNGADSTFSFNIRPRPTQETYLRPDRNQVVSSSYPRPDADGGNYGLLPQRKPTYAPDYLSVSASPPKDLYYDRESTHGQSPFSSGHQRPQPQNFYSRTPELKEALNPDVQVSTAHKLDLTDYDYLSRTLANLTKGTNDDEDSNEFDEINEDNYQYEDFDNSTIVDEVKKFDRDGYLRPALMLNSLGKVKAGDVKMTNATYLDDNYVLHMLQNSTKNTSSLSEIKPLVILNLDATTSFANLTTNLPDVVGKHAPNDILAEDEDITNERIDKQDDDVDDDDDYDVDTTAAFELSKDALVGRKRSPAHSIAFAPLTVLTKPDRRDNWVVYDTPEAQKPPLPNQPVLDMDTSHTIEVPTPIKSIYSQWPKSEMQMLDIKTTTENVEESTTASVAEKTATGKLLTTNKHMSEAKLV